MTVNEFHIGLDLILKVLKSEVYGSLQPQDKDYYLNLSMIDMITEKTKGIRDRYSMDNNVPLVRNFYSELGSIIVTKGYDTYTNNYTGSINIALPRVDNVEVDSGQLVLGEQYRILERGSTDLSTVTSTTGLKNGSTFIVTTTVTPNWDIITTVERISDPFMLIPLSIDVNLDSEITFTKGKVLKGIKYFAKTGTITSNKSNGMFIPTDVVDPKLIFTAKVDGMFDGTAGIVTTLSRLITKATNILLPTEYSILASDSASDKTNPVGVIHDNSITIYCDKTIHSVMLTYIKMPRRINSDLNINTDVSPVLHKDIVNGAAKLLLGINNDPAFNVIKPNPQ